MKGRSIATLYLALKINSGRMIFSLPGTSTITRTMAITLHTNRRMAASICLGVLQFEPLCLLRLFTFWMKQTDEGKRGHWHAGELLWRTFELAERHGITPSFRAEPKAR